MNHSDIESLLRGASLRVTGPRIAVLSVIHEHPHLDVGSIVDRVRERIGVVSTQAVYGVLNTLVDSKLARRIDLPGSPARYEGQVWDDHQHLVCRSCGKITDVDSAPGSTRLDAPQSHGFTIDHVEVTYWGCCPDCQAAGGAPAVTAHTAHPAPQP